MLLTFLGQSPSRRDVRVHVRFQRMRSGHFAFEAFSRVRMESLDIECIGVYYGRETCPFTDPSLFGPHSNALASSCPLLKTLKVNCSCISSDVHPVWQALPALRSLRDITLQGPEITTNIPEDALCKLSTLDSVNLQRCSDAHGLALRIGIPVTEVMTDRTQAFSAHQLHALVACPRLRKLSLRLQLGAEEVLPETVKMLPDLKVLNLLWEQSYFRPPSEYDLASPGMLLKAIGVAPKLQELHLTGIRIDLIELTAMLKLLGPRLRRFSTTIVGQSEFPLQRVVGLCRTAAKYNAGLLGFKLEGFVHRELFSDVTETEVHEALGAARWLGHNTMIQPDPHLLTRSIRSLLG